jgi:hypothetical protein
MALMRLRDQRLNANPKAGELQDTDPVNRNMELGILIREQTTVESISEHFQELIRAKVLVPVMQVETNRR